MVQMGETGVEFEAWYRALHPRLLSSLILITGNGETARDATDEAFTRAFQHWKRVSRMASPDAWTFTVARNVARRRARRAKQERNLMSLDAAGVSLTVPAPAGEAWALVGDLPERQRTAVVLRHVADLTEPEIARVMGITRGTVSTTLGDAHRALRAKLGDDGMQDPVDG
jgi:DNA-directed RNA polymerase specialized sigma24 family protein